MNAKEATEKSVRDILRRTDKHRPAEEKTRILLAGLGSFGLDISR